MNQGVLYGVGTGPGDPELMTVKAVKRISECPVIAVPVSDPSLTEPYFIENLEKERESIVSLLYGCLAFRIARQAAELDGKQFLLLPMPMVKEKEILKRAHTLAAYAAAERLKAGEDTAFLTLGDPCIYSTYLYLHREIKKMGFRAEIISGVPSFCAVSARLSEGLVENKEQFHVIPASYPLEEALALPGTKVFMKAGKQLGKVKEHLKKNGQGSSAVMVENCGLSGEKIRRDQEIEETSGYYTLLIVKEGRK